MKDRVATTTVSRYWTVPGLLDRQLVALDVGGSVLGGLASSRFDKVLVRDEQLAVSASANMYALQRVGIFYVEAAVKPGVDPALVEKRLDELVAQYIAEGPTDAEVQRAALREVGGRIRGLEQVGGFGGKAVTLAEGQTFAGDSEFYKKTLATYASVTPAEVQAAMRQWLTRPALSVRLEPGERPPYVEAKFTPDGKVKPTTTAAAPGRQARRAAGRRAHRARLPGHHPHHLGQRASRSIMRSATPCRSPSSRSASTPAMPPTRRPRAASRR